MLLMLASLAFAVDRDGDGYHTDTDCNDLNAAVNPGATETCNTRDDDCDGVIDDGAGTTWYRDVDRDGYGRAFRPSVSCTRPVGYVRNGGDCDDLNADISPGLSESCNGIDDDCDGAVDDGWTYDDWYVDADHDGFGDPTLPSVYGCPQPAGWVTNDGDCDDADLYVNPDQPEVCDDAADNDCDGAVDECVDPVTYQGLADASAVISSDPSTIVGMSTAAVADFDGDGALDLVAGDYYRSSAPDGGVAAMYLSTPAGPTGLGDADVLLTHGTTWMGFAETLAAAGDLDADGYQDLAIGAYGNDTNGSDAGSVFVYAGPFTAGVDLDADDAVAVLLGESASDRTPDALYPLGDIDGDGFDDLAVGAPEAAAGDRAGSTYLLYGPVSGTKSLRNADGRLRGEVRGDALGRAVTGLGDADGDGVDDFAVSAPYHSDTGTNRGSIYIYTHAPTGGGRASSADGEWTHPDDYAMSGATLLAPGDVNGDGHVDLVSTAYHTDDWVGVVSVIHGPLATGGSMGDAAATISSGVTSDYFGWNLADGGDTNGDGAWDLWVSLESQANFTGAAWLLHGPFAGVVHAEDQLGWVITGDEEDDLAGSLLLTGDFDGDGVPDPVVGTSGLYSLDPDELFLFLSTHR